MAHSWGFHCAFMTLAWNYVGLPYLFHDAFMEASMAVFVVLVRCFHGPLYDTFTKPHHKKLSKPAPLSFPCKTYSKI